jgi:hypothetical protein
MNKEEFLKDAEEIHVLGTKFVEALNALQSKYEQFDDEIVQWESEGDERLDSINSKLEDLFDELNDL